MIWREGGREGGRRRDEGERERRREEGEKLRGSTRCEAKTKQNVVHLHVHARRFTHMCTFIHTHFLCQHTYTHLLTSL